MGMFDSKTGYIFDEAWSIEIGSIKNHGKKEKSFSAIAQKGVFV